MEENKIKTEREYKITDLLKDYNIICDRIKVLYKILEINRCVSYNRIHSIIKMEVYNLLYGISINIKDIKKLGLIKLKEDMENISVRNNHIREVKNEIKRYHRLQSNIQNVLNAVKVKRTVSIYRRYNTEEVPSQFKNNMNYTYYASYYKSYYKGNI